MEEAFPAASTGIIATGLGKILARIPSADASSVEVALVCMGSGRVRRPYRTQWNRHKRRQEVEEEGLERLRASKPEQTPAHPDPGTSTRRWEKPELQSQRPEMDSPRSCQ